MTNSKSIRLLLDTSFCLNLIGASGNRLQSRFDEYVPGEVAISSLTVAALRTRARRSSDPARNERALEQFLMPLSVVDFGAAAAARLGEIVDWWHGRVDAETSHVQMLAAQAIQLDVELTTCRPDLYAPAPALKLDTRYAVPAGTVVPQDVASFASRASWPSRTPGAIIAIGSHDMTLDLLGDSLRSEFPSITLISAHVGSLNGLLALQRGEAHLAGVHLLDAKTGDFNVSFVERLLAQHGINTMLVGFVTRVQGIVVARHNPKRIKTLADLASDDVTFANRQPGAGTRVLLDYHLRQNDLNPHDIDGYDSEESSHLAVATAVASGNADCGLGIQAAAQARGLDFVPLFEERYDLAIPEAYYNGPLLAPLLTLLRRPSSDFLERVAALGGYDTGVMGQVMAKVEAVNGSSDSGRSGSVDQDYTGASK